MKDIKTIIRELVSEILDEVSSTGGVSGYQTPYAFSRKGEKNKATEYTEKMGYTLAEKNDDVGKEDSDVNNDGKVDKSDKYLMVRRKAIGNAMKKSSKKKNLKEDTQYDASKDIISLKKKIASTEADLEKKFIDELRQKFLGKNMEIQGSKGYGQFKTKYSLRVMDVSIEDWYGKDDYQLILTGEDKKKYFVDVTVPVKILTAAPAVAAPAAAAPAAAAPAAAAPAAAAPAAAAPAAPKSPIDQQISK